MIDVVELFRQAAMEVDNRKLTDLKTETVISQLGMDSVAQMELVSWFEERLGVRIPDEELQQVRTIGDLKNALARAMPPGTEFRA
jgi:acyl carrier protein